MIKRLFKRITAFFKENWFYLVAAIGIVAISSKLIGKLGKVTDSTNNRFVEDPADPHSILLYSNKEKRWERVMLPTPYKGSDVRAAAKEEKSGEVVVEIKHDRLTSVFD